MRFLITFVTLVLGFGMAAGEDRLAAAVTRPFPRLSDRDHCPAGPPREVFLDRKLFQNFGQVAKGKVEHRRAWSLAYGLSYDDEPRVDFFLLSYQDYDKVWVHPCPPNLKMKFEAAVGLRLRTSVRAVASMGMFAQYYIRCLETEHLRPYIDGGIGIIYTDFRRPGQGLRWNFNPRFSIGVDFKRDGKPPYYIAIRAHHVSNAGLDDENVGINSILLVVGKYF